MAELPQQQQQQQQQRILRSVVISGGGVRVLSFVGALLFLRQRGLLLGVRKWYVCSAGSLLAVLFALALDDTALRKWSLEIDFRQTRDFQAEDLMDLGTAFGMDRGLALRRTLGGILRQIKAEALCWTLADLKKKTGHDIHFYTSNVSRAEPFFVSAASHPNLFVIDAMYATMAIPLYFCPFRDPATGDLWCDGMLGGNFPWNAVPEREKPTALGLYFPRSDQPIDDSFFSYFNAVLSFRNHYDQQLFIAHWPDHCIPIPTTQFPSLLLELSEEDRKYLWKAGVHAISEWWNRVGYLKFMPFAVPKSRGMIECPAAPRTRWHSLARLRRLSWDTRIPSPFLCKDSPPSRDLSAQSRHSFRRWSV